MAVTKKTWRIKPRTRWWFAMDEDGQWYTFKKRPQVGMSMWVSADDWDMFYVKPFVGFPRIPKSEWNQHLYRVNKSGELVEVAPAVVS